MDAFVAEIKKIPPVTRFMTLSTLAVSIPPMLHLVSIYKILYVYHLVFYKLQLWRLYTALFYGGSGIQFLFDFIMLYRTSDSLESQNYIHRSHDYAWQLILVSVSLLVLNHPLGAFVFFRQLLITLTYLSSRLDPDARYSLFGLLTVPAKWWPYVLVAIDGVMGGVPALTQALTGLISGHAWYLLFWRDPAARQSPLSRAPRWLTNLITSPPLPVGASGPQQAGFGGRPREPQTQTGPAPRGHDWGRGFRLGE